MRIICDVDSIVVDIMTDWLKISNEEFQENLTEDSFLTWDMHKYSKGGKAIYSIIDRPGFFRHLPFIPGAKEGLLKLLNAGHDVRLVTAAVFASNYADKVAWVQEYLPELGKKKLAIMDEKHIVPGDVLIDDGPHNAEAYRKEHRGAFITSIAYPYNENCNYYDKLFYDHKNKAKAWAEMAEFLSVMRD